MLELAFGVALSVAHLPDAVVESEQQYVLFLYDFIGGVPHEVFGGRGYLGVEVADLNCVYAREEVLISPLDMKL